MSGSSMRDAVVNLKQDGLGNPEIAARLGLTRASVDAHLFAARKAGALPWVRPERRKIEATAGVRS